MLEQAILLAAGSGTRLKPLTDHSPKCLTEVNATPILINALGALAAAGTKRCTIVTGYMADAVERAARGSAPGIEIRFLSNDIYSRTGDMYSLWLAREVLEGGALVIEGDVFFKPDILPRADRAMESKSYYFAGPYDGRENEVVIETDANGRVDSIDVLRGNDKRAVGRGFFMSTGMIALQKDLGSLLSRWLAEYVEKGEVNVLFDDVLSSHVGPRTRGLHLFRVEHTEWVEIDTPQDLERAERVFGGARRG